MLKTFNNKKSVKVETAYTGDGIESYIIAHDREYDYEKRQQLASYLPVYRMAIEAVVDPIFSKAPTRESNNALLEKFLENTDREGTYIDDFMKEVILSYKKFGNGFIVMDNFETFPDTLEGQIQGRMLPWVRLKEMTELYKYDVDEYNNLLTIEFLNGTIYNEEKKRYEQKIIGYTTDQVYEYTVYDKKESNKVSKENKLGFIPVIKLDKKIKEHPSSLDAANTAIMIYNVLSEQRDNERSLAFAMLQVPTNDDPNEIEVGNKNIITVRPDSSQSAEYVSPDSSILSVLRESTEKYLEFFRDIADKLGATVVKSAPSGESLKMQFLGTSHILKSGASYAESLEYKIVDMFAKFINASIDYIVEYTKNYIDQTKDIKEDLELIRTARELGIEIDPETIEAITNRLNASITNY